MIGKKNKCYKTLLTIFERLHNHRVRSWSVSFIIERLHYDAVLGVLAEAG